MSYQQCYHYYIASLSTTLISRGLSQVLYRKPHHNSYQQFHHNYYIACLTPALKMLASSKVVYRESHHNYFIASPSTALIKSAITQVSSQFISTFSSQVLYRVSHQSSYNAGLIATAISQNLLADKFYIGRLAMFDSHIARSVTNHSHITRIITSSSYREFRHSSLLYRESPHN